MRKYIAQLTIICVLLSIVGCSRKWNNPVDPTVPPTIPVLILPSNNSAGISTKPLFIWRSSSGAESYTLQVSTSNTFTNYIYNTGLLKDTFKYIGILDTATVYYWRVVANDSYDSSNCSNQWSFTTGNNAIDWMYVLPGTFPMGSQVSDPQYYDSELPQHSVYLVAYQISKYEITNAQYRYFIDAGGYYNSSYWTSEGWEWKTDNNIMEPYYFSSGDYNSGPEYPDHPVVGVSWYEAYAFCKWAGGRLPTEAEWEKTAKGTDRYYYWPWGSIWVAGKCNSGHNSVPDTFIYSAPIGYFNYGQSPYGIFDMAGNVEEWCNDWYNDSYYSVSPDSNPSGPDTGVYHVVRGGSWVKTWEESDGSSGYRTVHRTSSYYKYPSLRDKDLGFRVAK